MDRIEHHHRQQKRNPEPRNQPLEVGRVSTIELILSCDRTEGVPGFDYRSAIAKGCGLSWFVHFAVVL